MSALMACCRLLKKSEKHLNLFFSFFYLFIYFFHFFIFFSFFFFFFRSAIFGILSLTHKEEEVWPDETNPMLFTESSCVCMPV